MLLVVLVAACGSSGPRTVPVEIGGRACGTDIVASGFVWSDGLVITNAHVVAGADELLVEVGGSDPIPAELVGFDAARDLALLAVEGVTGTVATSTIEVGDEGLILAADRQGGTHEIPFTVRRLIVATGGDIYERGDHRRDALDLAADIGPGDSGAGAFDDAGKLVGVMFASSVNTDFTSYAVAASEVAAFVDEARGRPFDASACP